MSLTRGLNRILTRDLTVATPPFIRNQGGAGGAPSDPDFSSVVLLLNFEDGADPWKDYSSIGATATEVGASNAVTTGDFKFGTTSYDCTANSYLTYPANNAYDLGTDLFTAEAWVKAANFSAADFPFFGRDGEYMMFVYGFGTYGRIRVGGWREDTAAFSKNYSYSLTAGEDTHDNAWTHVCFMGDGTTIYVFYDGVLLTSTAYQVGGGFETGTANPYLFGHSSATFGTYWDTGNLVDSMRITMGVARYNTAGFTPPAAAFPTS